MLFLLVIASWHGYTWIFTGLDNVLWSIHNLNQCWRVFNIRQQKLISNSQLIRRWYSTNFWANNCLRVIRKNDDHIWIVQAKVYAIPQCEINQNFKWFQHTYLLLFWVDFMDTTICCIRPLHEGTAMCVTGCTPNIAWYIFQWYLRFILVVVVGVWIMWMWMYVYLCVLVCGTCKTKEPVINCTDNTWPWQRETDSTANLVLCTLHRCTNMVARGCL